MKKIWFILGVILIVLSIAWPVHSQGVGCPATVIRVPAGLGLPTTTQPRYYDANGSYYTGNNLYLRQPVMVYDVYFNRSTGEIWFNLGTSWAQAKGGYTMDVTHIIMNNYGCIL